MTGEMCSRCGRSSNGREVQKERTVKLCRKGTGKNKAKKARNTFLD
jgi:hypothetical protein